MMQTDKPGIRWSQITLLLIAVVMISVLVFANVNDMRFVSSGTMLLYTWMMLMALLAVFLMRKGVLRIISIALMGVVSVLIVVIGLYKSFAPWENNMVPVVYKLQNDSRVAVIANPVIHYDASVMSVRFLAKPSVFGLFYKSVTPTDVMEWNYEDPNMLTDPKVLDYELPPSHGDLSYLFIVEKESLLVDAQKGICIKVKKKPEKSTLLLLDSLLEY